MKYDIAIIGAGIQGAACAQAASAAGYRVLVIEQYAQPAQGTSQRSSKLIHGGLRYLETAQFRLVRECLVERQRLLNNAPHLVKLVPFYIPVYKQTSRRPWKIALGLWLYTLLSKKPFKRIPESDWGKLDGLDTRDLVTVFSYLDAQTDDEKLTRAVLASAQQMGTDIQYETRFLNADITHNDVTLHIENDGQQTSIKSKTLINAAGPWVNRTAAEFSPHHQQPAVELVQGTHIVVPGTVSQGMYYLESPQDKRAIFVMPWKGNLLIGTTENIFTGNPENVTPLQTEIQYLLSIYNHYFGKQLMESDIVSSFAGLRVLPTGTDTAFSRPRDTLLVCNHEDNPRVVSLYGGKLTAHRATADDVMEKLLRTLPQKKPIADTRTLRLPAVD
ncbi:MAG: glycerol-3-phosphate dehydrogenase/oxidase [Gammaproteobacteria bacterium]